MSVIFGGIVPHPAIIIPEVGKGEVAKVKNTRAALEQLSNRMVELKPDLLVIISPHGPVFQDSIVLNSEEILKGDFANFRVPEIQLEFKNHQLFIDELEKACAYQNITALQMDNKVAKQYGVSVKLDHGVMVPLYYFHQAGYRSKLVDITMGFLSYPQLYKFGICLQKTAAKLGLKMVVIASGDLSHRLKPDAPAGFAPEGEVFDETLVDLVSKGDILGLAELDHKLIKKAGECGLRPIFMMLGALDGYQLKANVLSYEGPFGVGYLVAALEVGRKETERELMEKLTSQGQREVNRRRKNESSFVALARKSLETYVKEGKQLELKEPIDKELLERSGVFVSIKKHGQLRGCIGTVLPTKPNLAQEIIRNAISAGVKDTRFFPVEADELEELVYSVDVLKTPEPIEDLKQLDIKKYGVIVKSTKDGRSGLLLPNLEGIDSVEEQVEIACQKAGISKGEAIHLQRFEVVRYY